VLAPATPQVLSPSALVRTPASGPSALYTNAVRPSSVQALSPSSLAQTPASAASTLYTNGVRPPVVSTVLPANVPPFGDVDCSNTVVATDALKVLRFVAGLTVAQSEPCLDISLPLPSGKLQGDVDCSGAAIAATDALKILRYVAGLPVSQAAGCPKIGQ
jgi:hypothetical protein